MRPWLPLLALACTGPASDATDATDATDTDGRDTAPDTDTDDTADRDTGTTDTGPRATAVAASCTPQADNVLRFDCTVTLDQPGEAHLRVLDPDGAEVATWTSPLPATAHTLAVWGLWPESTFTVEAFSPDTPTETVVDTIATGSLPATVDLTFSITGAAQATEHILFNWGCSGAESLVVADTEGRVVWYQSAVDVWPSASTFRGFSVTPEGTVLGTADRQYVVEWDLSGEVLLQSEPTPLPVHHDVQRQGDRTWVILADAEPYPDGNTYVMDGFYVLDAAGDIEASWSSVGAVDPTLVGPGGGAGGGYWGSELGGAADWAHANALGLDGTGSLVFSLKAADTVLKVVADPDAADFGRLEWSLVGGATVTVLPSDLTLTSSTGATPELTFGDQHHVHVDPTTGYLMVYDNRPTPALDSRVLEIEIDEVAGTADILRTWSLGSHCPGQGSGFLLPNGSVLADCARDRTFLEILPDTDTAVWTMTPECRAGTPGRPLYRGVPIDLLP